MAIDKLAYEGLTNAHSRRSFLKKVGVVSGGLMAMGVVGEGMMLGIAAAQTAASDLQTLQFAYTLELVAVDAYKTAAGSGLLSPDLVAVGTKFANQHQDHANALKAAIEGSKGAVPAKPTKINYPAFKTQDDILNFALALESAAVGAYYASTAGFSNPDLAAAAASISGVEATHVALLSAALKKDPFPTAFTTGTPFAEVQKTASALLGAPAAGGQGGGSGSGMPGSAPSAGFGGAGKDDSMTGAGLTMLGVMGAAAVGLLAFKNRKTAQKEVSEQE